jgi:hypothetical protein
VGPGGGYLLLDGCWMAAGGALVAKKSQIGLLLVSNKSPFGLFLISTVSFGETRRRKRPKGGD